MTGKDDSDNPIYANRNGKWFIYFQIAWWELGYPMYSKKWNLFYIFHNVMWAVYLYSLIINCVFH